MTCYHPIRCLVTGVDEFGKKELLFVHNPPTIEEKALMFVYEEIMLPCGKCIGCQIKRSAEWATRMMLELKEHEKASFITITYNDENLPLSTYVDENGEEQISMTLRKRDFQLFMKRLRKRYHDLHGVEGIRFFACGEYGSKTKRPHYHAILFGVDFSEDRYVHQVKDGNVLWRSPMLEDVWPYGYSLIAEVNWNTCAYVSRYCTKKKMGRQNIYYQNFNIQPEFNLMSRRPGIARAYYEENKDQVYINQEIFLQNLKGGMKVRPPAYFDRLYDGDNPEHMEKIRNARKEMARYAMEMKLSKTDKNLYELLEVEEENFKAKISSLKREKV